MKKITAIFFLTVLLLSTTEAQQLLRLPFLFHHFIEHQNRDANTGFVRFLTLHYSQPNNNDNDEQDDMKLPFKATSEINLNHFIPSAKQSDIKPGFMVVNSTFSFFQNRFIPSTLALSVFHPPRA